MPEKIFCPQGYVMQRKIEKLCGLNYCREHCSASDKYTAMENTAKCYWIAKEGDAKGEQQATTPGTAPP